MAGEADATDRQTPQIAPPTVAGATPSAAEFFVFLARGSETGENARGSIDPRHARSQAARTCPARGRAPSHAAEPSGTPADAIPAPQRGASAGLELLMRDTPVSFAASVRAGCQGSASPGFPGSPAFPRPFAVCSREVPNTSTDGIWS